MKEKSNLHLLLIEMDLLQNKGPCSYLYESLAIEHSTALSLDNQHLIHLYKDKHAHRMVHFNTTTGKATNSWELRNKGVPSINDKSISIINTSLGFLILTTNIFVRNH